MTSDTVSGYHVEARRSGNWWAITVSELPGLFSQAKRLEHVESTAREAIAMMLDIGTADVGPINVTVATTETVAELLNTIQAALDTAAAAAATAADARREAAALLREEGLPIRDVGRILGLSHQRVSQILR